ncbi:unnamed protein product [Haemonchus placei]|uniref:AGPT-Pplase3 domain-containing protein n=1 Tax=Haemonchus placei TaxID=6290 RepID=A0A0N4W4U4_HAEPC|nr:unnamed protein product [Haemonchus placei]
MGALLSNETRDLLWNASVYVFEDDPIAFYRGYPRLGSDKQFYAVCVLYWEFRGEPFHCGKVMWNGRSSRAKEITLEQFRSFYERCSELPLLPLDLKKRPVKDN